MERVDVYKNRSRNSWNVLASNVSDLLTVSKYRICHHLIVE